jgi:nitroreductase
MVTKRNQAMELINLIKQNRSYRRFDQSFEIPKQNLMQLINLARLSASARNQQSLKYFISNTPEFNSKIFLCLGWAGYLTDWNGPKEGEHPSAYIVILNDTTIAKNHFCDEGIAAQSILLGAVEQKLGGCIIASVNKEKLGVFLNLPDNLEILLVLALGKPVEKVIVEPMFTNDYQYWRDNNEVHHVPKRDVDELIVNFFDY